MENKTTEAIVSGSPAVGGYRKRVITNPESGVISYGGRTPKKVGVKTASKRTPILNVQKLNEDVTPEIREVVGGRGAKAHQNSKLKAGVKLVYLGGVGEIGKNMTAIEQGNEIIVIDCGVMFPSEEMPGIDLVIPDYTYLKERERI